MSRTKWVSRSLRTEFIDGVTGEVTRITQTNIKKKEFDLYMKIYTQNKHKIREINTTDLYVLCALSDRVPFEKYELCISAGLVSKIAKETELTTRSIYKAIERLQAALFIFMVGTNLFYLNPVFIWKGSEAAREKALLEIKEKLEQLSEEEAA